ncbi:MAG: hypothetical protein ACLFM8_07200, partial [Halobacteriales archaeon]
VVSHVGLDAAVDAGAYVRRTHPASGWAMVGVAVALRTADGAVSSARVGLVGAVERPQRLPAVEDALVGTPLEDVPTTAATAARDVRLSSPVGDHHAGARYRGALVPGRIRAACRRALAEVGGP